MNFVRDLGTNGLNPLKKHVLKVDNRNATKRCEICPKLRINTSELTSFSCFFVNFEHISHLFSDVSIVYSELVKVCWEVTFI